MHTHAHTLTRTPHSPRAPGEIADTGEGQGACGKGAEGGGLAAPQRRRAGRAAGGGRVARVRAAASGGGGGPRARSPEPPARRSCRPPFHQLPLQRQSRYTTQARSAERGEEAEEEEEEERPGGRGWGEAREEGRRSRGPPGSGVRVGSSRAPAAAAAVLQRSLSALPARGARPPRRSRGRSRGQQRRVPDGEPARQSRSPHASPRAPHRARPPAPRRPRQVEGGGARPAGVRGRAPQKGFPARANVAPASGGERGRGGRSGPGGQRPRGSTPAGLRGVRGGRGERGGGEEQEQEQEKEGAAGSGGRRPGGRLGGHVVRYVPRARAAPAAGDVKAAGRRASSAPPRPGRRASPTGDNAPGPARPGVRSLPRSPAAAPAAFLRPLAASARRRAGATSDPV
ncbi:collagen alpha-2(I) chain-like [Equus quagga]|uniref:collagen alpha-2(I) chain-like n=1 Tax=Equus quagga TaxID=89248 RepID=UPI001EE30A32|nr:collagen alpha-2(I) chain-like [Equus quagga]